MTTKSRRRRAALRAPRAPAEVRPAEPASDLRGRQPVGSLAPWSPFYPPDGNHGRREKLLTVALALGGPALIVWGPGVGIYALVHGGDARLGNLISGALLTLALPVLIWRLARRVSRQDRATREDLIEGIW